MVRTAAGLCVLLAWFGGCTLLGNAALEDKPLESELTSGAGGDGGTGGVSMGGMGGAAGMGGAGGAPECIEHVDCPGIDTTCRFRQCTDGVCGILNADLGTSCAEDGGKVCDDNGGCVACNGPDDCVPGDSCVLNTCVPPHCVDGAQNVDETDVDCGGAVCASCMNGLGCMVASDCVSQYCNQSNQTCAACSLDSDCAGAPDTYCAPNGVCVSQKILGDTCGGGNECLTGFCPADDGLCCDAACNSTCEACLMIKTGNDPNGTCGGVAAGQDPDMECSMQAPSTCGNDGTGCNGSDNTPACNLYPNATQCVAPSCSLDTETTEGLCDGGGNCNGSSTNSCLPFTCSGTACLTNCSDNNDCAGGNYCSGANCLVCGTTPSPPGGACPAVCDTCNGDTCVFNCTGSGTCESNNIVCPPGFHCQVNCTGNHGCRFASIQCPSMYDCDVICNGASNACNLTAITASDGTYSMMCGAQTDTCTGATVACGNGECTASCTGASKPNFTCGPSCGCTPCP